jgi:hypothetical protein
VPLHRRWINDVIHFGKKSHVVGSTWRVNPAPLVAARAVHPPLIGWGALWMKALALVGQRRPELRGRRICLSPGAPLRAPECVRSVVVEPHLAGRAGIVLREDHRAGAMIARGARPRDAQAQECADRGK